MITADKIKSLRGRTGISIAECKKALESAGGDEEKAIQFLREAGEAVAEKKAARKLGSGAVVAYIHATGSLGAILELRSETDFVSKNKDFRLLADDLAMQITAMSPVDNAGLLEQPFIKDSNLTVAQVIKEAIQKFGERIEIGDWHRLEA